MKILNVFESQVGHDQDVGDWVWLGGRVDPRIQWLSVSSRLRWFIGHPRLARYLTAWCAVSKARQVDLIVTHGERMAVWVGLLKRLMRVKTTHLAWAFTTPEMDKLSHFRISLFKAGLHDVDRIIMFSRVEAREYPRLFGHSPELYDMVPWSSERPVFNEAAPRIVEGDYIASMGGEGRDYKTLFDAVRNLSDIKLVVVTPPERVEGLDVPKNVVVYTNIPYEHALNIAFHSQFMVMPLTSSKVAAGHSTLVTQFLLEKASVVTEAEAMEGYCENGVNSLTVPAGNSQALREVILRLREQPALRIQLTKNALTFARTHCSEGFTIQYFHRYLREKGLLSAESDSIARAC
jgi:hypothetical protein